MNDDAKIKIALMLPKDTPGYGNNDMIRRVYSVDGIAPTIRTYGGGNLEPKVIVYETAHQTGNKDGLH